MPGKVRQNLIDKSWENYCGLLGDQIGRKIDPATTEYTQDFQDETIPLVEQNNQWVLDWTRDLGSWSKAMLDDFTFKVIPGLSAKELSNPIGLVDGITHCTHPWMIAAYDVLFDAAIIAPAVLARKLSRK